MSIENKVHLSSSSALGSSTISSSIQNSQPAPAFSDIREELATELCALSVGIVAFYQKGFTEIRCNEDVGIHIDEIMGMVKDAYTRLKGSSIDTYCSGQIELKPVFNCAIKDGQGEIIWVMSLKGMSYSSYFPDDGRKVLQFPKKA